MSEEFNSTFQWLSWIVLVPLFFIANHYRDELKNRIYPNIVSQQGKRQMFDLITLPICLFTFLMIWGYSMEWFYNN